MIEFGDGVLRPLAPNLWTAATPIRFAGTFFSHVMTVVRMNTGALLLHSPCKLSNALLAHLAELGNVSDVVAPSWFHDLYLADYRGLYPEATFWAPVRLARQLPKIIDRVLERPPRPPWFQELPYRALPGLMTFDECIFSHTATKTVIVADLLTNAVASRQAPLLTKAGYWLLGLDGTFQIFPITAWFSFSCRQTLRDAAEQIATWAPERIIVGHGSPITEHVPEKLKLAFHRKAGDLRRTRVETKSI